MVWVLGIGLYIKIWNVWAIANINGDVINFRFYRIEIEGRELEQVNTTIDILLVDMRWEIGTNLMGMAIQGVRSLYRQRTKQWQ